jgi:hypothetical protein
LLDDATGCPTCDCLRSTKKENKDECAKKNNMKKVLHNNTFSNQNKCNDNCTHGYYTDEYGCETCECKPIWMSKCSNSLSNCANLKCEFGHYLDSNGCKSCICLPNPNLTINCNEFAKINTATNTTTTTTTTNVFHKIKCDEQTGFYLPVQCNEEKFFFK